MDQFAQTREPDNLFDDDFTPISEPIVQPIPPAAPRHNTPQYRPRGNPEQRQFLRGSRQRGSAPPRRDPSRPQPERIPSTPQDTSIQQPPDSASTPTANPPSDTDPSSSTTATNDESGQLPLGTPSAPKSPAAVRGNRLQTGGVQKPKLTEDELSERLAAAKINNAKREAAHAAAEADEASFLAREAHVQEKRREEGVRRREMEGERERNRERKLKGKGGREWDEGKEERFEEAVKAYLKRGAYGGVVGGGAHRGDLETPETFEEGGERGFRSRGRGRGRGRRRGGPGRGRGEGRGAFVNEGDKTANFGAEDFPALSTKDSTKPAGSGGADTSKAQESVMSPVGDKGTWAEEMEAGGT